MEGSPELDLIHWPFTIFIPVILELYSRKFGTLSTCLKKTGLAKKRTLRDD